MYHEKKQQNKSYSGNNRNLFISHNNRKFEYLDKHKSMKEIAKYQIYCAQLFYIYCAQLFSLTTNGHISIDYKHKS